MSKPRHASANPFNVLILLLIIFNSGGVELVGHYYLTIATLILLIAKLLIDGRFSVAAFAVPLIAFSIALSFNYLLTTSLSGINEYLVFLSYIFTASWVVSVYRTSVDDFRNDLYLALKIVMYHSIISFLFQFVGEAFIFPYTKRDYTFYYLFFYIPTENVGSISRSQGIFWEPGVLQMYLNLLFYMSYFMRKNLPVALLSAVAILTTFSTAGYLILFILILAAFVKLIRKNKYFLILLFALLPIISIPVIFNINNKISGESANSASVRMFDMIVGVSMLMDHPLAGVGLERRVYKDMFYSYGMELGDPEEYGIEEDTLRDKGITNSVLFLATSLGLPLAALFLFFLYKQPLIGGSNLLVFTIFFLTGLSEPLFNTTFFTIMFVSGLLYLFRDHHFGMKLIAKEN